MAETQQQSVVIVGAGIVGACTAYYLRKAGWQVTIVDQGQFGKGCSHANCGLISPSHALPLAMPGVIRSTLPMIFKKSAPFRIKPTLSLARWSWFLKFAGRCRQQPMLQAMSGRHALLQSSIGLYEQLIRDEQIKCEWQRRGALFVYKTQQGMDKYAKTDRLLSDHGLPARRLDGDELVKLEPALRPGLAGGWFYDIDAHLRPNKLMSELQRVLQRDGVQIIQETRVLGARRERGRTVAIQTDNGDLTADQFVVATGSWTPFLKSWLGMRIPIQPGKGYSITMPHPTISPKIPLLLQERKVAVTPMDSCYRLGSTMEFAGYDASINRTRLQALRDGAADYLLHPDSEPVEEEWFGWRPMTYDGLPIIDRSPASDNVMIAAGHNMLGVSMGTATGKLVSELISGTPAHLDPQPYSAKRF